MGRFSGVTIPWLAAMAVNNFLETATDIEAFHIAGIQDSYLTRSKENL